MGARTGLVVFVFLAVCATLAQDPTKVESKHYKLAFENEFVQVVNVHYGPHEKSSMHEHPGGVVVVLTAAHLKFTDQNGKTKEISAEPGESRWFPPFKHKVENLGDTTYNAVYIGIKNKQVANAGSANEPHALDAGMAKILADYIAIAAKP
jgi:quercetin dioxygenase-like cupin family protein